MASVYKRGSVWWIRVKKDGRWISRGIPHEITSESDARLYANEAQRILNEKAVIADRRAAARVLSDEFSRANHPSTRDGWVYVIALTPDLDIHRVKIGWTTKPVEQRLRSYRTTNPGAALLGIWDAHVGDESRAHDMAEGRIGASEVFSCVDIRGLLERLDAMFTGARSP